MESNNPLVSVIIPVYNTEKYLKQCVDSIIAQTYANLEVILVDDGSSDSSGNICDVYSRKDDRVKVIHQENAGVSTARNMGINAVSGDYIMFVDADDEITPRCIEVLLQAMKQYCPDIVCADSFSCDSDTYVNREVTIWQELDALKQALCYHLSSFSIWAKLYRKDIIGDIRFSPKIKINEDSLFLFELFCKKPKVVSIDDKIYYYRPNAESASNAQYSEKFEDILLVAERKHQIVQKKFPELLHLADNTLLKARMNLLKILCVRTSGEKKVLEKTLVKYIKRNYKSHISTNEHDDRWLRVIRYNLYSVYKFAYRCLKRKHRR